MSTPSPPQQLHDDQMHNAAVDIESDNTTTDTRTTTDDDDDDRRNVNDEEDVAGRNTTQHDVVPPPPPPPSSSGDGPSVEEVKVGIDDMVPSETDMARGDSLVGRTEDTNHEHGTVDDDQVVNTATTTPPTLAAAAAAEIPNSPSNDSSTSEKAGYHQRRRRVGRGSGETARARFAEAVSSGHDRRRKSDDDTSHSRDSTTAGQHSRGDQQLSSSSLGTAVSDDGSLGMVLDQLGSRHDENDDDVDSRRDIPKSAAMRRTTPRQEDLSNVGVHLQESPRRRSYLEDCNQEEDSPGRRRSDLEDCKQVPTHEQESPLRHEGTTVHFQDDPLSPPPASEEHPFQDDEEKEEEEVVLPGAYPTPGRAPGQYPAWGRNLRRAFTRRFTTRHRGVDADHTASGDSEAWTDGSEDINLPVEATEVTDAEPIVYATVVKNGEDNDNEEVLVRRLSDAEDRERTNRYYVRLFGGLTLLLMVVIGISTLIFETHKKNHHNQDSGSSNEDDDDVPSKLCTSKTDSASLLLRCRCQWDTSKVTYQPSDRYNALKAWVLTNLITSEDDLKTHDGNTCTPSNMALLFLADEDKLALEIPPNNGTEQNRLTERYVLSTLYFATKGDTQWINNVKWISNVDICYPWRGVGCNKDGSTVEGIVLEQNGLVGTLPKEIGHLMELRTLHLKENNIIGSITDHIGNLTDLRELDLSHNNINGTIPMKVSELQKLRELRLSGNSIEGSIHSELGNLGDRLALLELQQNLLRGSIPSEIGTLTQLEFLSLADNELVDTLPTELGKLDDLESLNISSNSLIGPIPDELGNLKSLELLDLSHNKLNGTVPDSVCSLVTDDQSLSSDSIHVDCTGPSSQVSCSCCAGCTEVMKKETLSALFG